MMAGCVDLGERTEVIRDRDSEKCRGRRREFKGKFKSIKSKRDVQVRKEKRAKGNGDNVCMRCAGGRMQRGPKMLVVEVFGHARVTQVRGELGRYLGR